MVDQKGKRSTGRSGSSNRRGKSNSNRTFGPGIKSGMTVEDLKRLTKLRMEEKKKQESKSPPVSGASPLPSGMTVQELKQLTNMRLASAYGGPPNTDVANRIVLSNAAKSQFRETLNDSTGEISSPNTTPYNNSATVRAAAASSAGSRAKAKQQFKAFAPTPINTGGTPKSTGTLSPRGEQLSKVQGMFRDGDLTYEEKARAKDMIIKDSLNIQDDIPPPPPLSHLDQPSSSVPSWSPPASASRKEYGATMQPFSSFYHQTEYEKANNEQNAAVAPPPGLARRPSMTVPWQVAESVLNTPQATASRKRIGSNIVGDTDSSNTEIPPPERVQSPSNSSNTSSKFAQSASSNGRRGSFGNAAQFFRFRRRSKSRLEIARDVAAMEAATAAAEEASRMPGISENQDMAKNPFFISDFSNASPFGNRVMLNNNDDKTGSEKASTGSVSPRHLPAMSPNGVKLRQLAELSRRGSLSGEEKTKAKDEIIQNSMSGSGSSNIAAIAKIKAKMSGRLSQARKSIEFKDAASDHLVKSTRKSPGQSPNSTPSSSDTNSLRPPPGFGSFSLSDSTPPGSGSSIPGGIVRSTSIGRKPSSDIKSNKSVNTGLEERLAEAAKRVASCVASSNMEEFAEAMAELDRLKNEAKSMMKPE